MTADPTTLLALAAVLAVAPVALVLLAGSRHPARPRLSPGRFFLGYAVIFSGMLLATRYLAFPAALSLLGIVLGLLGTISGSRAAARLAFGADWLDGHDTATGAGPGEFTLWHVAAWVSSILAITVALAMTYLGSSAFGPG